MRLPITILLLSLTLTSARAADPIAASKPAAIQGLATLRELVTDQTWQRFGFQSEAEGRTASQLGPDPFVVYTLGTAAQPLGAVQKVIWPVVVGDRLCCSITVEPAGQNWRATRYGAVNLTRLLTKTRLARMTAAQLPAKNFIVLESTALRTQFVSNRFGAQWQMAPLTSKPALGLSTNELTTSAKLLHQPLKLPPPTLIPE